MKRSAQCYTVTGVWPDGEAYLVGAFTYQRDAQEAKRRELAAAAELGNAVKVTIVRDLPR